MSNIIYVDYGIIIHKHVHISKIGDSPFCESGFQNLCRRAERRNSSAGWEDNKKGSLLLNLSHVLTFTIHRKISVIYIWLNTSIEEFLCSKTLASPALMHQVTLVPKQQVLSQHTPPYVQQKLFIAGLRANLKSHQKATLSLSTLFKPLFRARGGGGWCHTCHWNN